MGKPVGAFPQASDGILSKGLSISLHILNVQPEKIGKAVVSCDILGFITRINCPGLIAYGLLNVIKKFNEDLVIFLLGKRAKPF